MALVRHQMVEALSLAVPAEYASAESKLQFAQAVSEVAKTTHPEGLAESDATQA